MDLSQAPVDVAATGRVLVSTALVLLMTPAVDCFSSRRLGVAVLLGRRRDWPQQTHRSHNLPLMLVGAALLWFGW